MKVHNHSRLMVMNFTMQHCDKPEVSEAATFISLSEREKTGRKFVMWVRLFVQMHGKHNRVLARMETHSIS
jgi:hypothetical protein